ncbi:23S rRNA (uracil(1939)-C(5))-methyltransferase RlmD [Natranaerobius trueperi]|uniref:23S rRNA (Uracil(1939)-C(5))-methyltransferase RlmD n=1 Tax=Natranaerobius trueperi TaxID=759412 RepID=A0A226C0A3_9FIRM|nr:23S rRNA (uracil(1939)-C(5))-methyltransferase RlmD [Natranaerobius trueperi]OWZ84728.1 23S rRNA (uracil(1939)-C(5))-methyltransferase RlmD [Natranaerobius trueperi]
MIQKPVEKKDILTLDIHDLNHQGEGVGKYNNFTIFVPFALPGEQVTVEIDTLKKNYAKASVKEYHTLSEERVEPPCPYYYDCGGCQLQHLSYKGQLAYKEKLIENQLIKIAQIEKPIIEPIIGMENPWYYRNKLQSPVRVKNRSEKTGVLGFFRKNSHQLVEIDHCMIQKKANNHILEILKNLLEELKIPSYQVLRTKGRKDKGIGSLRHIVSRTGHKTGETHLTLVTRTKELPNKKKLINRLQKDIPNLVGITQNINNRPTSQVFGDEFIELWGQQYIKDELINKQYRISPAAFYQVNPEQTEKLYNKLFEICAIDEHDRVLDAYSGIGTITLLAADKVASILGVEEVEEAVQDSFENKDINQKGNVSFLTGKVEEKQVLKEIVDFSPNTVFVDPPRKGCDEDFLQIVSEIKPQKIGYVSCDPSTLARDIGRLKAKGYKLTKVVPIDLFPQTVHVEAVALIELE